MQFAQSTFMGKQLVIPSLILLLFCSVGAAGQTEDQLGVRLKKVAVFEVRPGIDVFPSFATDGRVCRMVVEKRQYIDSRNADFSITIPNTVANQLVDDLVPPTERGKASKYLSSDSFVAGGASFIKQDYENVSVGMYGTPEAGKTSGVSVIVISWPKRTCSSPR